MTNKKRPPEDFEPFPDLPHPSEYEDLEEEEEEEEEEEGGICGNCNGSGEGSYDGSTCYSCSGSGDTRGRGRRNR